MHTRAGHVWLLQPAASGLSPNQRCFGTWFPILRFYNTILVAREYRYSRIQYWEESGEHHRVPFPRGLGHR